jgi:hypothetical protein
MLPLVTISDRSSGAGQIQADDVVAQLEGGMQQGCVRLAWYWLAVDASMDIVKANDNYKNVTCSSGRGLEEMRNEFETHPQVMKHRKN